MIIPDGKEIPNDLFVTYAGSLDLLDTICIDFKGGAMIMPDGKEIPNDLFVTYALILKEEQ